MILVQSTHMMDHGKQENLYGWIPGHESWQEPTVSDECRDRSNTIPLIDHKNKDDSLCSRNVVSSSQLSTEVNMSETSTPNFVYKRRIIQNNAVLSLSQSSKPTFLYKRQKVQSVNPTQGSANRPGLDSKSGSVDGASLRDELTTKEEKSKLQKYSDLHAVNDSCSSSKSNMDHGSASMKPHVDDVGECSSSGVATMEGSGKDILETNPCILFLRRHGVLEERFSARTRSMKPMDVATDICGLRACKVCERSTTTLKMLICDLCEEAFHMSCCNPAVKKVPVDDWFCHSCLRKKLKKVDTNSLSSSMHRLGPIASMLTDTNHYASNVRIGKKFQVEVPDWSGPLINELDDYSEPTEMSPLECASNQDWDSSKLSRLSSIGNWLQCREVVDRVKGTICGKWRRAPLFEVQTDEWECFCSVFWDPTHADCAVRQELDTDQVLKQLKYIEMLRPRLTACKKVEVGSSKGGSKR